MWTMQKEVKKGHDGINHACHDIVASKTLKRHQCDPITAKKKKKKRKEQCIYIYKDEVARDNGEEKNKGLESPLL
jgi:hypothetical protein